MYPVMSLLHWRQSTRSYHTEVVVVPVAVAVTICGAPLGARIRHHLT